jgi:hypothetical protein
MGRNSIVPCIVLQRVIVAYFQNFEDKHPPECTDELIVFIGSKGWGIELLGDGEKISEHVSRFRARGVYHPWVEQAI